jgi:hypothetical protein
MSPGLGKGTTEVPVLKRGVIAELHLELAKHDVTGRRTHGGGAYA